MAKKKQNKKFRKIEISDLNSSASTSETDTTGFKRGKKNDCEDHRAKPSLRDEGTPYSEDSVSTTNNSEVASSEPMKKVHDETPEEALKHFQNECSLSNTEKGVTCVDNQREHKNKDKHNKNRNNSQINPDKTKPVEEYSIGMSANAEILLDDLKPAVSNSSGYWKQERTNHIEPDCSQIDSSAKRTWNPNASEFKPKSNSGGEFRQDAKTTYSESANTSTSKDREPSNVRYQQEKETGNEGHSSKGKRDDNHNYSKHGRGSERSGYPSRQFSNKHGYGSNGGHQNFNQRGHGRYKSNVQEKDAARISKDGRGKHTNESEKTSFERRDSSSAKEEYKYQTPTSFVQQPDDPNWDLDVVQQPDDSDWDLDAKQEQLSYGGHEEARGTAAYDNKPLDDRDQLQGISNSSNKNEGPKGYQDTRRSSSEKPRKQSLERSSKSVNAGNEKLGATKKSSRKDRNLQDPRMVRENQQRKDENAKFVTGKDEEKGRKNSTGSDRTEREDLGKDWGDEDWDLKNNQDLTKIYDAWNNEYSGERNSYPESNPKQCQDRKSDGGRRSDGRTEKFSYEYFDRNYEKTDAEYKEFNKKFRSNKGYEYVKVIEKEQDLFDMPKDYSLGHCVAEDFRMGSGIAVTFKRDFKDLDELLGQRQKQGGLAILENNGRFIYYLVTKKLSTGKPTYETFWSSLKKMREHILQNKVQKLAIPRIGCGLDRLDWNTVKYMIEFLFTDVEVEIVVCNFQQMDDTPQKDSTSTRLVYHPEPLKDIAEYTIILYFSTEDGHISNEMEELNKKFDFLSDFRRNPKKLGMPIRYEKRNYILYGCIVRRTIRESFDFKSFVKCLLEITRHNRKDLYEYVALEPVYDKTDDILNEKIITLLRNLLKKVDIYICSGKTLEEQNSSTDKNWRS